MPLNNTELLLVQTELTIDPQSIGYSPFIASNDYVELANMLNTLDPLGSTVQINLIHIENIHNAVSPAEYDALSVSKLQQWETLLGVFQDGMVEKETVNLDLVKNIFPAGSTSYSNILALRDKPANRVEAPEVLAREYLISAGEVQESLEFTP